MWKQKLSTSLLFLISNRVINYIFVLIVLQVIPIKKKKDKKKINKLKKNV